MKKNFYLYVCFGIFAVLGIYACTKGFDDGDSKGESGRAGELTVIEAQAWFADYAADFTLASLGNSKTRGGDPVVITPLWDEARTFMIGDTPMVEVPLNLLPGYTYMARDSVDLTATAAEDRVPNTMIYLLAQKDANEDVGFRVVHIVADSTYLSSDSEKALELLSVSDLSDFSGSVFYYDVLGNLLDGAVYLTGHRVSFISPNGSAPPASAASGTRSVPGDVGGNGCELWHNVIIYCETDGVGYKTCWWGEILATFWICPNDLGGDPNPGGGDPPPAEKPDPAKIAPKASKIFRNSKLSLKDWENLEKLLNKMTKDCLGGALYNGLMNALNGGTLVIDFDLSLKGGSSFDPATGNFLLGSFESNILFHEMFHAYQSYNETYSSFMGSYINQEIEARCAQYMYISRTPEYQDKTQIWYRWYDEIDVFKKTRRIGELINSKGKFDSSIEADVSDAEKAVAAALMKMPGYWGYPFDTGRSTAMNLKNIQTLAKGC